MADQTRLDWYRYFPHDYRWSAAMQNILSTAPYGGSDIGEVHLAEQMLTGREGDDEAWFTEWEAVAERVASYARLAERDGHERTACAAYLRAANYFHMAERFRTPKDERAMAVFSRGVESFHAYARLTDVPRIEIVEVPFEQAALPAYFVHPSKPAEAGTPAPCVVFFDGLDLTKELQYLKGVADLVKRGMSCLVVDAPGYGQAIRERELVLRPDYETVGAATLDYLQGRPDVDSTRVGVMGISLGGYYAPRAAALEHRFAACVAWGAIWDYQATWEKRIAAHATSTSVPHHHIKWILGAESYDEVLDKLTAYRLDVVEQMRCPFLLVHGADDQQIPLADAEALYEAVGSADKTMKVFTNAEGGSQHCQRDLLTVGSAYVYDWLQDKLCGDHRAQS
jgi:dienelactone hydrolase